MILFLLLFTFTLDRMMVLSQDIQAEMIADKVVLQHLHEQVEIEIAREKALQ